MTRSLGPRTQDGAPRAGGARQATPALAARGPLGPLGPLGLWGSAVAAGNRAVAGVLARGSARGVIGGSFGGPFGGSVQRAPNAPGWSGSTGWNAGTKDVSGVNRVPVDGLTLGNQQAFSGDHTNKDSTIEHGGANERAKTAESAAGRAVVLVPKGVSGKAPISVLLHLHGYTSRSWDPYGGWRERQDGTVRDVALDRLAAQLAAAGDPQVVGILPQGVGHSEFGKLDPSAYIDEVLRRLVAVAKPTGIPLPDPAKGFSLILSAHSGGGHTVRKVLDAERTSGGIAPAEVVLFEAINNSTEQKAVTTWALGHLDRTLAAVAKAGDPAGKDAAIAACPVLRAYRSRARQYADRYDGLQNSIDAWFADAAHQQALGGRLAALRDHFRVTVLKGTAAHEQTVRGIGDDPAGGPMADALSAHRDPSRATKLVTEAPAKTKGPGRGRRRGTPSTGTAKPPTTGTAKPPTTGTATLPARQASTAGPDRPRAVPAGDFVHDLARTTIELLPAADRSRFEGIAWVDLDYPGAKMKVKDTSQENLEKWRGTPGYEVFEGKGTKGPVWYLRGSHQAQAQQLLDALSRARPGGGERRANLGRTAVLTSKQYKKDPAAFDTYIVEQLADVTSYDRSDPGKTRTHALNKHAAERFGAMVTAAAGDGVHLSINNSYRTRAKATANAAKADNAKAVAKYSSHSLGLAVDLNLWVARLGKRGDVSTAMGNVLKLLGTPGYKWMYQRGAEFGFYQYRNEPWHWEYNPAGFRDTFWSEAAELAPQPEPEPPAKRRSKR